METYEQIEKSLVKSFGMEIHKTEKVFSQKDLYNLSGRNDYVSTLTLRPGSKSFIKYGETLTGTFSYTLAERAALEKDQEIPEDFVKFKELLLSDEHVKKQLREEGICICDITELTTVPYNLPNNLFSSTENREVRRLIVPFNAYGNGDDINWIYGFLKRLVKKGVGISPDEYHQYLAYKFILEPEELSDKEKKIIFTAENKIRNEDVSFYYLLWEQERLREQFPERHQKVLKRIRGNRLAERFLIIEEHLKSDHLSWKALFGKHVQQARFIFQKAVEFKEISFNHNGKSPLYLNFKGFVHIYFRHVQELKMEGKFEDRDRFQLFEHDIIPVMQKVMDEINDDYQVYRTSNPTGRYDKTKKNAIYLNGDYYNVVVESDGSIVTFYKGNKIYK